MSVKDMIKKSVLESGAFTNYDVPGILTALAAGVPAKVIRKVKKDTEKGEI